MTLKRKNGVIASLILSSRFLVCIFLLPTNQVTEGIDFKGKPARNIALVNATMDRIPFLKVCLGSEGMPWFMCPARHAFLLRLGVSRSKRVGCVSQDAASVAPIPPPFAQYTLLSACLPVRTAIDVWLVRPVQTAHQTLFGTHIPPTI